MSVWGINLPLDLPMWALTSISHVKLGKYELSDFKSFILISGVFWGCWGCQESVTSDMTLQCWRIQNDCQICPIIYFPYSILADGGWSASWFAYMKPEIVILVHQISVWGIDLPLDLPMWALTSISHVKLGKYELSELKSFILICGVFGGFQGFWGCQEGVTSHMTLQC